MLSVTPGVMWGTVTGFISAGEARQELGLTSYFLLPGLADMHFAAFSTHSQTRQQSNQTYRSVICELTTRRRPLSYPRECVQRLYVCQFEIINQRKRERDVQDVLLITAPRRGVKSLTRRIGSWGAQSGPTWRLYALATR